MSVQPFSSPEHSPPNWDLRDRYIRIGDQYYEVFVTSEDREIPLSDEKMREVALHAFDIYRLAPLSPQQLPRTKITEEGLVSAAVDQAAQPIFNPNQEYHRHFSRIKDVVENRLPALPDSMPQQKKASTSITARLRKMFSSRTSEDQVAATAKMVEKTTPLRINNLNQVLDTDWQRGFSDRTKPGLLTLPGSLMLPRQERKKNFLDSKSVAPHAVNSRLYENASRYVDPSRHIGFGYHEGQIQEGRVVPTSFRSAAPDSADHLANCYVGRGIGMHMIRSGVIDTPQKAEEFAEVVQRSVGNRAPLRVATNQLNGVGESSLTAGQHEQMARLSLLRNSPVAHISTPSNRWYHITRDYIRPLGKVGHYLDSKILKGEAYSREQNLEGWARYADWVAQDIGFVADLPRYQDEPISHMIRSMRGAMPRVHESQAAAQQLVIQIGEVKQKIKQEKDPAELKRLSQEKKALGKLLKVERSRLKDSLKHLYGHLCRCENELEADSHSLEFIGPKMKITLFRTILEEQLDIPGRKGVSRGQEEMMIHLLNDQLGVISGINCKSGLDRTGFLHSVKLAMREEDPRVLYDTIIHWDETTKILNTIDTVGGQEALDRWFSEIPQEDPVRRRAEAAMRIRKRTLVHLVSDSLPITGVSTGLLGLKWKSGMSANLIPLNFIPPVIEVEGKPVRIVKYDEGTGEPKGLTDEGHLLLTQLSPQRHG